ncbi:hypothetical protein TWF730_006972 [Orbilia blumenaviensis]|uniref:Clr5 domain-containing protein n=1 Tax=Orbilia blumenaviensis TaxID=1796055 RepID=A0AAV9VFV8_9PEZI
MDLTIVQSQPAKPARPYVKRKAIEVHKDFILENYKAGQKQQDILTALRNERGFDIKPHNLKRILDKWGVSHKILTKKRKLYIRQAIGERRQIKNLDPCVKFGRSNRMLNHEEIQEIMSLEQEYFKDVRPSPGDIELSSPALDADGGEEEEEEEGEANLDTDVGYIQAEGIENDHGRASIDRSMCISEEDAFSFDQTSYEATEGDIDCPEETTEDLQKVILDGIKELGIEDDQKTDLFYEEEDFEFIEDAVVVIEDEPHHVTSDAEAQDWSLAPLRRYSRLFESDYLDWVDGWKDHAAYIVKEVDKRQGLGISHEEAFKEVLKLCDSDGRDFLPYEVCMNIQQTETDSLTYMNVESDENDEETILPFLDKLFADAVAINPSLFLPEYLADKIFWCCVAHLPRIIREYGHQSFFTALCLRWAFELLVTFDFDFFQDRLSPLAERSIQIFEAIGMGSDRLGWCDDYHALSEDKCPQRSLLLQRLQVRYGRDSPYMLSLETWKLYWMIKEGDYDDPAQQQAVQELQSKILHKIDHGYLNLENSWTDFIFVALAKISELLHPAGNMILVKILHRRILAVDFGQLTDWKPGTWDDGGVREWNLSTCALALGVVSSWTNKLTLSLKMLIQAYGMLRSFRDSDFAEIALDNICHVADARGPVLYEYLDPILSNARKQFKGDIADLRAFRWRKILAKRNAYRKSQLQEEYTELLSLRSCKRSSTPDLQQYLFDEGLKSWLHSQGVDNIPDNTLGLGGYVMEWEKT